LIPVKILYNKKNNFEITAGDKTYSYLAGFQRKTGNSHSFPFDENIIHDI
jgi:hypothetical protein